MYKISPFFKNLLLFLGLIFLVWFLYHAQDTTTPTPEIQSVEKTSPKVDHIQSQVSEKVAKILSDTEVQKTLERIKKEDEKYQKDGAIFMNREKRLPIKSDREYYSEWTVTTPGGRDRGARRIIVGKSGELWFTDDHYQTFTRIQ